MVKVDLADAMERNLAAHCHLHRATPGMTVVETSDLLTTSATSTACRSRPARRSSAAVRMHIPGQGERAVRER
ncbi:hypothetical protein EV193_10629 [Herbihabitans rhizosphaerae]|uniref:Uncharacterized protein n=1 Tax=Herbihabitans rhizosphaerae TaxID=1872711 RepID=A0A4Q7KK16_9PSEU|nr:hypothetical protein [Herbihabitans rhizosphaerae]RZS36795.1 hypothetical protein EV193_10629 [Herbihabitans rhizosphaerae]